MSLKCSFCGGVNERDSVYCVYCGNRLTGGAEASTDTVLPPGSFVREYKIIRLVGEGGMGQVYEGAHPLTGARVAIKRMVPGLSADDGLRKRFIEEARVMTLVNHPSVIPIHQFFVEGGRFFLVMKFVDGTSLEDVIVRSAKEGRPVPLDEAVGVAVKMASALHHLHHLEASQEFLDEGGRTVRRTVKGVIHRDVKPANILLDNEGGVFLTDFGVAKAEGRESMTRAGGMVGTYEYMSPEQIQGMKVGPASDQYALAVTIYNLLTGQVPFPQTTEGGYDVMEGHVRQPPPPLSQFRPELPAGVEAALTQALEKDPEARFPDCKAFGAALKAGAAASPKPPSSPSEGGGSPLDEAENEFAAVRRPPYLIIGIIGAVVLGVLVLILNGAGSGVKTEAEKIPEERTVAIERAAETSEESAKKSNEALKAAEQERVVAVAEAERYRAEEAIRLAEAERVRIVQEKARGEAEAAEAAKKQREQEGREQNHRDDCRGKSCGTDRHGQSCGACAGNETCEDGVCVRPRPKPSRFPIYRTSATDWNYRLKNPGKYGPDNVLDGNLSTAWCKENGGASITLHLSGGRRIHEVRIRNGYQKIASDKYGDRFYNNSRVEKVSVRAGDVTRTAWASDSKGWQALVDFNGVYTDSVEISPETYYWGRDRSVCISEIEIWGTE